MAHVLHDSNTDLTFGGVLCKAKALFLHLAPLAGFSNSSGDLDCYKLYSESFLLPDDGQNVASLHGKPFLKHQVSVQQYKLDNPDREPQFFSFFSPPCIDRLGKCLNVELVIYRLDLADKSSEAHQLIPFVDYRAGGFADSTKQVLGFCFCVQGCLHAVDLNQMDCIFLKSWIPSVKNITSKALQWNANGNPSFIQVLGAVVSKPCESFVEELKAQGLSKPDDLLLNPVIGHSIWCKLGFPILVVAFECLTLSSKFDRVKCSNRYNRLLLKEARKWKFKVIAFCGADPSPEKISQFEDLDKALVVSLWGNNVCSLLTQPFANAVKSGLQSTQGKGERLTNRFLRNFSNVNSAARKAKLKSLTDNKSASYKRLDNLKKWCECTTCKSKEYDSNMAKSGPERLVTTSYTPLELIEMLGMGSSLDCKTLLSKVGALSIASMDIESRTVEVDLTSPRPGPGVPYAEIDNASLEGHVLKVQKPVMLAHLDGLDNRKLLQVSDDSEEAVYDMMKNYLETLLTGQQSCFIAKAKLLQPLMEELRVYREAFFAYCVNWKEQEERRHEREVQELKEKVQAVMKETTAKADSQAPLDSFLISNEKEDSCSDFPDCDIVECAAEDSETVQQRADNNDSDENSDNDDEFESDYEILFEAGLEALANARPRCLKTSTARRTARFRQKSKNKKVGSFSLLRRRDSSTSSNNQTRQRRPRRRRSPQTYESLCVGAWKTSLFGQLQEALTKLCQEYIVFSFYG